MWSFVKILVFFFSLYISDEVDGSCQAKNLYECADGQCIYREQYCDGTTHCKDGSDEIIYTNASKSLDGIKCTVIKGDVRSCFLSTQHLCDGYIDCLRGEDECNCNHTFRCGDGITCRLRSQFCDSKVDCVLDHLDEQKYRPNSPGYQCAVTKTHVTNYCMLPMEYVCDGINDCDDGTDECFCDNKPAIERSGEFLSDKCFRCLDTSLVIPLRQRCDGLFHCSDLTDECLCLSKSHTFPPLCQQLCKVGENCGSCKVGEIKCKTSSDGFEKCINRTNVCDRIVDCAMGEDEKNCGRESLNLFACADGKQLVDDFKRCNLVLDCSDGSDEDGCDSMYQCKSYTKKSSPPEYIFDAPRYTTACDGLAFCEDLDDECNATMCSNHSLPKYCDHVQGTLGFICPNTKSARIGKEICDGFPTCNPAVPNESVDERGCQNRFYCADHGASKLPIHIPLTARCNAITDCFDGSDEVNCSEATHFYCSTTSPAYISHSKVCNGNFDCANGEDECQNCTFSPFSSDQFLINSTVLRVFVWVVGIIAVAGNILVLCQNGNQLRNAKRNESDIVSSSRVLAINLALADLMIGVYLIILGVKDVMYQGVYCYHHLKWKSSIFCTILGCVALVSIETSMFVLTVMTTCRLIVVKSPLPGSISVRKVVWSVVLAWVVSIMFAVIPLLPSLQDTFTMAVWYMDNPYAGLLNKREAEDIVLRIWSLQNQSRGYFTANLSSTLTWGTMTTVISRINSSYVPARSFGYYSSHGVCLPRIFPNSALDKSSSFSLFLMVINFAAFAYIVLAYLMIYRIAVVAAKKAGRTDTSRAIGLQKNITRITVTNFLCWVPVCIISFISLTGGSVDPTSYAVAAIVLLPINSATNPFLYSEVVGSVWKTMPRLPSFRSSRDTQTAVENTSPANVRPHDLPMGRIEASMHTQETNADTTM
ncbi:uncharacterized protein LOC100183011 isoform X2 [Ciona intestinalis]